MGNYVVIWHIVKLTQGCLTLCDVIFCVSLWIGDVDVSNGGTADVGYAKCVGYASF